MFKALFAWKALSLFSLLGGKVWGLVRRRPQEPQEALLVPEGDLVALEAQAVMEENAALHKQVSEQALKAVKQSQELDAMRRRLLDQDAEINVLKLNVCATTIERDSQRSPLQARCQEQAQAITALKKRLREIEEAVGPWGSASPSPLVEQVKKRCAGLQAARNELKRLYQENDTLKGQGRVPLADCHTRINLDKDVLEALAKCNLSYEVKNAMTGAPACTVRDFVEAVKELAKRDQSWEKKLKDVEAQRDVAQQQAKEAAARLEEAQKRQALAQADAREAESELRQTGWSQGIPLSGANVLAQGELVQPASGQVLLKNGMAMLPVPLFNAAVAKAADTQQRLVEALQRAADAEVKVATAQRDRADCEKQLKVCNTTLHAAWNALGKHTGATLPQAIEQLVKALEQAQKPRTWDSRTDVLYFGPTDEALAWIKEAGVEPSFSSGGAYYTLTQLLAALGSLHKQVGLLKRMAQPLQVGDFVLRGEKWLTASETGVAPAATEPPVVVAARQRAVQEALRWAAGVLDSLGTPEVLLSRTLAAVSHMLRQRSFFWKIEQKDAFSSKGSFWEVSRLDNNGKPAVNEIPRTFSRKEEAEAYMAGTDMLQKLLSEQQSLKQRVEEVVRQQQAQPIRYCYPSKPEVLPDASELAHQLVGPVLSVFSKPTPLPVTPELLQALHTALVTTLGRCLSQSAMTIWHEGDAATNARKQKIMDEVKRGGDDLRRILGGKS